MEEKEKERKKTPLNSSLRAAPAPGAGGSTGKYTARYFVPKNAFGVRHLHSFHRRGTGRASDLGVVRLWLTRLRNIRHLLMEARKA
jgi:hypothetical protein